jgi:hypothetical protein
MEMTKIPCPNDCDEGRVEVLDHSRIRQTTISPPYEEADCKRCEGTGFLDEAPCFYCGETFGSEELTAREEGMSPKTFTAYGCADCIAEQVKLERVKKPEPFDMRDFAARLCGFRR